MQDDQRRILDFLMRPGYTPVKPKTLAKKLGYSKKEQPRFFDAVDLLCEANRIHRGNDGRLRPRVAPGLLAGIVRRTTRGSGYFIPHAPQREESWLGEGRMMADVYIAGPDMQDAHSGDEVLIQLLKRRRSGGQRCGRVVEIIQRATTTFVGTYFEREDQGYVQIDGTAFADPVLVGDPGAKRAQPGDKVVIDMLRFPSHYQSGEAVLERVLGARSEPGVDELSIIHEFGLPSEFPEAVLEDARRQAEAFDETDLSGRVDLSGETIVTIDPVDAHDFDDAISLTRIEHGHWRLGVHIADVAHFVRPNTPLDVEAKKRGTSVYLPGRALPMLPELVSNGLASLQQGRVRFAKSVFIEFTPQGIPVDTEFVNSAVQVTKRLSFDQVMPIVRQPDEFRHLDKRVRKLLSRMHQLAMILRKRRFEAGALDMSIPEVKVELDAKGRATGGRLVVQDEAHQIVEEFMLAANMAVAAKLQDLDLCFLRRVHDEPSSSRLRTFAEFVRSLGFTIKQSQSRHELQAVLNHARGKRTEYAVNYAMLRSMKQAEYSAEIGHHYALAVPNYCHFTSPIRRYPDLTVHRLIGEIIDGHKRTPGRDPGEWAKLAKVCSFTERRADSAVRELTKVKLLTFLQNRVGESMNAVITHIERFGFFCQGLQIPAEGLVHISTLAESDHFDFDRSLLALVGRRSGREYRLGDRVRVTITHVDVDRRSLDFRLDEKKHGRSKGKSGKRSRSRKSKQKNKRRR